MRAFKFFETLLTKVETFLIIVLLSVMLLLGFTQVLLRNLFHSGLVWGDIVLRHLVLWIGFIGALLATSSDRHISIDIFSRFFSPKLKHVTHIIVDVFSALICVLLFRAALTFIGFEISENHVVYGDIPSWYAQSIIPVGYGLLTVHFLLRAVDHLHKLVTRRGTL